MSQLGGAHEAHKWPRGASDVKGTPGARGGELLTMIPEPAWKPGLNFLTAWFCPFAQRTWIALEEKGIPYALQEVALKDPETGQWRQFHEKPQWFLRINPLGKVPVLVTRERGSEGASSAGEERTVYESLICNEYLEDAYPEAPPLLPAAPADRARARIIMDRWNSSFTPHFYRFLVRQEKEVQEQCRTTITDELRWLESQADAAGPHLLGAQFSLVDAAILPWFLRMPVLAHFRDYQLPDDVPRLRRWAATNADRPSVKATQYHPEGKQYAEELMEHYSWYAEDKAKSTSAKDFR